MSDDTLRSVRIDRTESGRYVATNVRGGTLTFGSHGDADFSPVELLLAAIGGCTAIDADVATSRHAEPLEFTVSVQGDKVSDEQGQHMTNLAVTFHVSFPEGEGGDRARTILPRAVKTSHDRLCTVSRTVEIGTPVTSTVEGA
ncbi:putative redox protein [Streptacidiphilus sp. MAP12-33]|uniref:OsmC family protein n=1 Tax=Streptacidiphilus sp. MAP12-33 TaxID=3156266 RepID=UPI00351976FE